MRILLVIDHLGLGGAQRQVVELACGLHQRGHDVEVFNYFPEYDFFRPRLEATGVAIHDYWKGKGFSLGVLVRLAALVRQRKFDVVISYLNSPNIYTELTRLLRGRSMIIVSERCSHHDERSALLGNARRSLHILSDHVVTNSETHNAWLRKKWWLKHKTSCIYNGVDLKALQSSVLLPHTPQELRLLAVGRICPQKNLLGVISALDLFYRSNGYVPTISWVGKRDETPDGRAYWRRVEELLSKNPVIQERWRWLGEKRDIPQLWQEHHALIHPSFYEGLSNAVCEALAAGRPVLASNVSDHPQLVADGQRGFLFDPLVPESIMAAIHRLTTLTTEGWIGISHDARKYAECNLGVNGMVTAFEALISRLERNRALMRTMRTRSE